MTISTTNNRVQHNGDGSSVTFAFGVKFFAKSDVKVSLYDTSSGTELTAPTQDGAGTYDFIISATYDAESDSYKAGGNIVFNNAPPATYRITIYRETSFTQSTDYVANDAFPAETHERALDKLTVLAQQLYDRLLRTPALSVATSLSSISLPLPIADAVLKWNSAGTDLESGPTAGEISSAQTYATNASASATSAASSATAAAGSATSAASSATAAAGSATSAASSASTAASAASAAATAALAELLAAVVMTYDGVDWTVHKPDGTVMDISSSTTDGLQEALTYAATNRVSLYAFGGGGAVISCTSAIAVPALQNARIWLDVGTINFDATVTGAGFSFDSCMQVDFYLSGQIVYAGDTSCVYFYPQNGTPVDNLTSIIDSRFYMTSAVVIGGAGTAACVAFNTANGPIQRCTFEWQEINGANGTTVYAAQGIIVTNGQGFTANTVKCQHLHLVSGQGFRLGTSTGTGADGMSLNDIYINVSPKGASSIGIQLYGPSNRVFGSVQDGEGTVDQGLKFETTATNNIVILTALAGATPIVDNGINNRLLVGNVDYRKGAVYPSITATNVTASTGQTLTAAQLVGGWISRTGLSAAVNDTTDTAANIVAAAPIKVVGALFTCRFFNNNGSTVGLNAGAGVTRVGRTGVLSGQDAVLTFRLDNVTGGAEAVTVFINL